MQQTINNNLIKSIEPLPQAFEIWDDRLRGLMLRVQPTGLMTYYVQYGRGKRYKIGRADVLTPTQARNMAAKILGEAAQGIDPVEKRKPPQRGYTLEQFIEEVYKPWVMVNLKCGNYAVRQLKISFPHLMNKQLTEINAWMLEKWRSEKLKEGLRRVTINRKLSDLKAMFSRAVAWGFLREHPIMSIKRLKTDSTPIVRYLSPNEERRLREALDTREQTLRQERASANRWRAERGYPLMLDLYTVAYADHLKPLVLLSMNTGLRKGETFNLLWSDIDFNQNILTVRSESAKSRKTRHIPLNHEAQCLLRGWRAQARKTDGYVFPGKNGHRLDNVKKSWKNLLQEAEITNFRWHDLRHTFASNLVMAQVDLNTVRELLGHADYNMTLRYAHLAPKHKAEAVERLVRQL